MDSLIYKKNMDVLKKLQPRIVDSLKEADLEKQDEFKVEKSKRGHLVLKVKKEDGNYIQYNSSYDPYKEVEGLTRAIDYNINRSLILIVGVGLGYSLEEVICNLNEKSIVLVVEKSKAILKNMFYYKDFSEAIQNKKVFFAVGDFENDNLPKQLLNLIFTFILNVTSIQPLILNVNDLNYIHYSKEVIRETSEIRSTCAFCMGNDIDDTLVGIDNMIKNVPHIIKNPGLNQLIEKYKNAYKGKPAIVIASGPSLDKNIHFLKEAKGKALLLACDGSMDSLKKHGIIPDAVSSVERIMTTYEAFYKNKKMPEETVLVGPAVIRPEIFECFSTKTLSLFKSDQVAVWFDEMVLNKGRVWSGASVAHQLVGLAKALGADPIILVGQDLAYSTDGVSHTSEASVKEKVNLNKVKLFVKDINGKNVPTTYVWKQFLEIYESAFQQLNINCIDATEGGAYIKGTKVMPLKEAIDSYCVEDVPDLRKLVDSLEVDDNYALAAYRNVFRSIIRLARKFWLISRKCSKSMMLNSEAKELIEKGITSDDELDRVYDAMDYTEYRIVKYLRRNEGLYMFFQYLIMRTIIKVNDLGSEVTLDVLSKNLDIQKSLLADIKHYCHKALKLFEEGFIYMKKEASIVLSTNELEKVCFPDWENNLEKGV